MIAPSNVVYVLISKWLRLTAYSGDLGIKGSFKTYITCTCVNHPLALRTFLV